MFPETKSRETLRVKGKQNSLFPSGEDIKCILMSFRILIRELIEIHDGYEI